MAIKNYTKFRIIFFSLSLLTALIIANLFQLGSFESTRVELKKLIEEEISGCTILSLEERKYPGKGMYTLFQVDCKADYYPVLLDASSIEQEIFFTKESLIWKKANSHNLQLQSGSQTHNLKIRSIESESDNFLIKYIGSLVIGLFFIGTIMTILNWVWKFY